MLTLCVYGIKLNYRAAAPKIGSTFGEVYISQLVVGLSKL